MFFAGSSREFQIDFTQDFFCVFFQHFFLRSLQRFCSEYLLRFYSGILSLTLPGVTDFPRIIRWILPGFCHALLQHSVKDSSRIIFNSSRDFFTGLFWDFFRYILRYFIEGFLPRNLHHSRGYIRNYSWTLSIFSLGIHSGLSTRIRSEMPHGILYWIIPGFFYYFFSPGFLQRLFPKFIQQLFQVFFPESLKDFSLNYLWDSVINFFRYSEFLPEFFQVLLPRFLWGSLMGFL